MKKSLLRWTLAGLWLVCSAPAWAATATFTGTLTVLFIGDGHGTLQSFSMSGASEIR